MQIYLAPSKIRLVDMREFSIDYKPSRQYLTHSGIDVGSGHRNQIHLQLDRLCIDLEHNDLFF